jgi:hypothetical protein
MSERGEQHDAGVVDQDASAAQFGLDTVSARGEGIAVGDVGPDGNRVVAQFASEGLDPVGAPGEQCKPEAARGQGTRGGRRRRGSGV